MSTTNQDLLAFFSNADTSSAVSIRGGQINAPMVTGSPVTAEEMMMGGGVRLVLHIIDASGSMACVGKMLRDGFTCDYIPAIKGARGDDISALRLAGMTFSRTSSPIWNPPGSTAPLTFHALDELPPLTVREYNPEQFGATTAWHQALIDGLAYATSYAALVKRDSGVEPEIDIIGLIDGDNNEAPYDPLVVRKMLDGVRKDLVRFSLFFFDTSGSDDPDSVEAEFKAKAIKLGFDQENIIAFTARPGESPADLQKRFRRMLRVMSRVSASKGMSAVNATALPVAADVL